MIHHHLRGEWHSSNRALKHLGRRLRRKGAEGNTIRFYGEMPHGAADAMTPIDLAWLVGAEAVVLPPMDPGEWKRWAPALRGRARRWGVRVAHGG